MKSIGWLLCWLLMVYRANGACDSVQADVIFLIDASGSVRAENFIKELEFAANFSKDFHIGPSAVQVGVITFSTNVDEQFTLNRYSDKIELIKAITSIYYTLGSTFTNLALQYIREHGFTTNSGDRPGAPNIVIILTDGVSNAPDETKQQADLLRNDGVEVYAIGIGSGINATELDKLATNHGNVFMVENFNRLAGFITTIKDNLCQNLDPCSGFQCQNGGTCQNNNGAVSCQCVAGYTGQHCDSVFSVCESVQADVIFLIDASGSVGQSNFNKQLGFAADFSNAFTIGPSALQVGVIKFSDTVNEEFKLTAFSDKAALTSAIRAIWYTRGSTFTNLGLQYIRENCFTSAGGDRPGVPNIVILLTDGTSKNPTETKEQAALLRSTGAEIYAIGIGHGINSTELDTVATDPQHVYMVETFDRLVGFITTMKDSLCQNLDPCNGFLCQHGGKCQKTNGAVSCQCVAGYTGQHCDTGGPDLDPCNGFLCQHGGTCQKTNGAASCQCVAGYTGQHCDTDIDECVNNPCQHGGTCSNSPGSYSCQCATGWFAGNNCHTDIDECTFHNPCLNGASCKNTPGSYTCQCTDGYEGNDCNTDIDECTTNNPCLHGATCTNTPGSYSCQCTSGYEGPTCQTDIDECATHNPCLNGATCTNTPGSYSCQCTPGYEGNNCQTDVDECATSNPCLHGATCLNTNGSYNCQCTTGYEGNNCQTDVDECSTDHPCNNGATCENTIGSYTCTCNAGYMGQLCNIDINECSISNPCGNGATCTNTPGSYRCHCAPGFEGDTCQLDIDECATGSPCNNGHCINKPGSYTCQCNLGYQGSHCEAEINECMSLPCKNEGVCFDGDNDYTCGCNAGFTGKNCEIDVNECDTTPCRNGATCHDGINSFTCQCIPGYTGSLCDIDVDECASHPCQHGGTCTDLFNDYNCTCKDMIVGKNCQTDLCADVAPNCGELFGVCRDPVRKSTLCRGTCGVCGNAQIIFAGQTQATTAATVCMDMIPDCGSRWGVCRDHAMAETKCQKTCGVCGTSQVVFG